MPSIGEENITLIQSTYLPLIAYKILSNAKAMLAARGPINFAKFRRCYAGGRNIIKVVKMRSSALV